MGIKSSATATDFSPSGYNPDISPLGSSNSPTATNIPKTIGKLLKTSMEIRAQLQDRSNPMPVASPHVTTQRNAGIMPCANFPISPSFPRLPIESNPVSRTNMLQANSSQPSFLIFWEQS